MFAGVDENENVLNKQFSRMKTCCVFKLGLEN